MMFTCPVCREPYPMMSRLVRGECTCRNCWLFGITAEPQTGDREDQGLPVAALAAWYGRCDYVNLYRTGFYRGLHEDLGALGITVLDGEAQRLHAEWDEHEHIRPNGWPIDPTAWMVYADWLDEHNFPLNAKAVRCEYNPAFRDPVPSRPERQDLLRPKNPEPLRRLRLLEPDGDASAV